MHPLGDIRIKLPAQNKTKGESGSQFSLTDCATTKSIVLMVVMKARINSNYEMTKKEF